MATFACKFGSTTFSAQDWGESAPQRIETAVIPRRDGALASDGRPDAKRITIRGVLSAATAEALRTAEDTLLTAFHGTAGGSPIAALRIFSDRYINAQLESWQRDFDRSARLLNWQASFLAATPYWLAETAISQNETPNASPFTITLSGAGTATALPVITVTASADVASGLKLVNATANAYIQYNAAMSNGDVLVLDHDALTAEDNGSNVLASIAGDFWSILPGSNTVYAYGLNGIAAVNIAWRDRWF